MPRRIRVFISSPTDVREERLRVALIIDKLEQDYNRFVSLEAYRWESEAMLATGSFQDSIEPPSSFDIVILILWSRLGTPLPVHSEIREYKGTDGRAPVTGTEWEFEEALRSAKNKGAPSILAFRNVKPAIIDTVDMNAQAEALSQLAKLNEFWTKHFADRGVFLAAYETYRSTEEFASRVEALLRKLIDERIREIQRRTAHEPIWLAAPFRGLQAYEFEHAPIFFGRDVQVAKALHQLAGNANEGRAFLLISGSSGSGKSSLVKAAIVPKLMKPQRIQGMGFIRRLVFRPSEAGGNIVDALIGALVGGNLGPDLGLPELLSAGQSKGDLVGDLNATPGAAGFIFRNALNLVTEGARAAGRLLAYEEARLILVVDQLEELFSVPTIIDADRKQFVNLLASIAGSGAVWVICTMRSDFWPKTAEYNELIDLCAGSGRMELGAPTQAEIAEIIRKPAEAAGLAFEVNSETGIGLDAVLTEQAAAAPGVLPLLSFTLESLFRVDILKNGGQTLTYATFDALGGLEGAIAKRADETVAGLSAAVQSALPKVLRKLATAAPGSAEVTVARSVPLQEFPAGSYERQVIESLIAARLAVTQTDGDLPLVRISHEALLRRWKRARDQLAADQRDLQTRALIETQMSRWAGAGGRARQQLLLRDPDLAMAMDLSKRWKGELSPQLREYIERSYSAAMAAIRRKWALAAIVMVCLATLAAASFAALHVALIQRTEALAAESRFLSRDSRFATGEGHTTLGLILGLAALPASLAQPDRPFVSQAENALEEAFANRRERFVLKGHDGVVWSANVSPSGKRVVTASADMSARLWDAATGVQIAILAGHTGAVWSAIFSPDGKLIATASDDGTARLWDAETGAEVAVLRGHTDAVSQVVFSGTGTRLITLSDDNSARLWNPRTGNEFAILRHPALVNAAKFSPDGTRIATGSADGVIRVWDAASGAEMRELIGHHGVISAVEFSPNGRHLLSGSWDKTARLWDADGGGLIHVLDRHQDAINSVSFSPDGSRILTASADGIALLWDAGTGLKLREMLGHAASVESGSYSADGLRIVTASSDSTARIWDADTGALVGILKEHDGFVNKAVFSPNGKFVVTASNDGTARVWEVETWASTGVLRGHSDYLFGASFSPDGRKVATASYDKTVRIWDAETLRTLEILAGHSDKVYSAAFSPDGHRIVSASEDRTARLWDTDSGVQIGVLNGHTDLVSSATFSPNGTLVVTTSKDATARLWDVSSGVTLKILLGHGGFVSSATFSPNGSRIVTSSWDKTARVWDVDSGAEIFAPLQHSGRVSSAIFSVEGDRILTASDDRVVRIWNATNGALMATYGPNAHTLQTVALSPDGRRLVAPAWDGTVQVWETETGRLIASLRGHVARANSAVFSPDGTRVLSASWDNTARLWRLPSRCQALIEEAQQSLPRKPNAAEEARYSLGDRPHGTAVLTIFKRVFSPVLPPDGENCR